MKNITVRSMGGHPWEVTVFPSGSLDSPQWYVNVNPASFIWRSFNLKDVMVSTGYLDQETRAAIEEAEGIISGHVIVGLGQNIEIKKNQIVALEVKTGPNLYPISAEVKVIGDENKSDVPWIGWPEPFILKPPLEFENGILKDPGRQRYCYGAYHIIGYLSYDPSFGGTSVTFDKENNQFFVQSLKDNLLMSAFNYEGIPVTYGIPFHFPYLDSDKDMLK